jgi:pteridine reductase
MSGKSRPVAVVTGGARRVGKAIVQALCAAGCDAVVTYNHSQNEAEHAAEAWRATGATVELVRLDLKNTGETERFAARLSRERARLDVLVHNASIYSPSPLATVTEAEALRFYRVNALAPLMLTRGMAARLSESQLVGGAAVIAMADIHAMGLPRRDFVAYSMSKAALVEMVRALAVELAPRVRVNGVAPGVVAWPEHGPGAQERAQVEYLSRVPLGRSGTPEDAAGAVKWLALEATYVTGQVIRLDGGRSLR